MMAETSVPVDLTNPGQVFACLGFLEAAEILLGDARGGFDWRLLTDVQFRLAGHGSDNPIERVLRFLDEATVRSFAPTISPNSTDEWGIETEKQDTYVFPFTDTKPDVLPVRLSDSSGKSIMINHWGEQAQSGLDRVKFWAGMKGKPGAKLTQETLDLIQGRAADHAEDPFSLSAEQSSSFRFDWRRDYVPIDLGFSPNAHNNLVMRGYPIVELLAAIGLTNARPTKRGRLEYCYGVAGITGNDLYDPIFLRAALGSENRPVPGMSFRLFAMHLDWPGKEGHARCITEVIEETQQS